jgi:hypothetical protein
MAGLPVTTLVDCHFSNGQRGLELAGLLHLCVICFHQIGMIAFKKTAGILTICRANCVRTVCICMCWFCFISKNENINGSGTIGLDFLFLTKSVW